MKLFCSACQSQHDFKETEMERVIYTLQMIIESRHLELNAAFAAGQEDEIGETGPYFAEPPLCLLQVLEASCQDFEGRCDVMVERRKAKPHLARPDHYNPRDVAMLGGDPSL